ncbi:MAG: hypothetical protein AB7O26_20480, partial [Planctomycetaceae bacterium]
MESWTSGLRRFGVQRLAGGLMGLACLTSMTGCFAPLCYSGVPACELPDSFRTPTRSVAPLMNLANLAL